MTEEKKPVESKPSDKVPWYKKLGATVGTALGQWKFGGGSNG